MTPEILKRRLAAWPAASVDALGPALDAAAETVADALRQRVAAVPDPAGAEPGTAVTVERGGDGRAVVTITRPDAVALEFGTRRTEARPFLRPAVAATRDGIGRRLADALRHALTRSVR